MWPSLLVVGTDQEVGSQEAAVKRAKSFLEQHRLWPDGLGEPEVSPGSSVGGGSGYKVTSWIVYFEGQEVLPGINRSISVRVGPEAEDLALRLRLPRVESMTGKAVRLRSLSQVATDTAAWRDGYPSSDLQEKANGPVQLQVRSWRLIYEAPPGNGEYPAIPVYEFEVEIQAPEKRAGLTGTWRVLAAEDVDR